MVTRDRRGDHMTRSSEPIPRNVQHCRNLLQGTGYDVFKCPPKRWTERFSGHPLEAQAYFLTGYLARADKDVRQDLRDLIRGVGIAMPPTVDEDGMADSASTRDESTSWSSEYMGGPGLGIDAGVPQIPLVYLAVVGTILLCLGVPLLWSILV